MKAWNRCICLSGGDAMWNCCGQGDGSCLCCTVSMCTLVGTVALNSPFTGEGWRIEVED